MSKFTRFASITVLLALLGFLFLRITNDKPPLVYSTHELGLGELQVWIALTGQVHAKSLISIASRNNREALLIDLVPDGTIVKKGDLLAQLDSRNLERQLHRLEKEAELADNSVIELINAKHPLQIAELRLTIDETERLLVSKRQYLVDSESLARKKIISDQNVQETRDELVLIESKLDSLRKRLRITLEYLHPAQVRAAEANLKAARRELSEIKTDIQKSQIYSPGTGVVSYVPLSAGGEFRGVRVGDSIYPNQPFLVIPDMSQLLVKTLVHEMDIGKVARGATASITPMAYPELTISGIVTAVGRIAQQKPQRPSWQKYFPVTVELNQTPPELLPGLSVTVHVLSYHKDEALLIPRNAITWIQSKPHVRIPTKQSEVQLQQIVIGNGDQLHFEVIDGLAVGDIVLI